MLGDLLSRGLDQLVERGEMRIQEVVDNLLQGSGFSSIIATVSEPSRTWGKRPTLLEIQFSPVCSLENQFMRGVTLSNFENHFIKY